MKKKYYLFALFALCLSTAFSTQNYSGFSITSQDFLDENTIVFHNHEATESYTDDVLSNLAISIAEKKIEDTPIIGSFVVNEENKTDKLAEINAPYFGPNFITIWDTTQPGITSNNEISIPTNPAFVYNYSVDWGDGTTDTNITGDITHTYATTGIYTVSISGSFPAIYFNNTGDRQKIIEIIEWGDIQWQSMENAFYGCSNLNFDAIDTPDLSGVSTLKNMFRNAGLFNGIINSWDVSTITDISGIFQDATNFNRPLDNWNVGNVTDMSSAFNRASRFNEPLDSWNTGSVTNMSFMFRSANAFNQNIESWNVGIVTDMTSMFESTSSFNLPLNSWNVSQATNMSGMFRSSSYNLPLTNWDVSQVTDMSGMFQRSQFNQTIDNWDVSAVTNMSGMFEDNRVFNQPINSWDVSAVTDMSSMFAGFSSFLTVFNQPLDLWDVRSVTDMSEMFQSSSFNQAIDGWDVSSVTDMSRMFQQAENFNQALNSWNVSSVESMADMFEVALVFDQPLNNWNVSQVTNMRAMFNLTEQFNQPLNNWDVSAVEFMDEMFQEALVFNQSLADWDVSNVRSMTSMLDNAALSRDNYDATLTGWSALTLTANVSLGAQNLRFCDSRFLRQDIIDNFNWSISGDQLECDFVLCTPFISPMDGDTDVPANFSLFWEAVSAATGYRLTVLRRDSFGVETLVLDNVDVGNTTFFDFPTDFVDGDTVFATVVPYNGDGPATGCTPISFTVVPAFANSAEAFKLTYDTRIEDPGSSLEDQLRIDINTNFSYNYSIDWGDGQFTNNVTAEITHTYLTPGVYTIAIIGQYPTHFFNGESRDNRKLLTIDQWGTQVWQSMRDSFIRCTNMTYNATDVPNLTQVTDMSRMFRRTSLFNGNINNWDVSNVTNMSGMFDAFTESTVFNQPLDNWDVSNVTDMSEMFQSAARFNQNINSWDVSNVVNMRSMFSGSFGVMDFNQPLNNWDVSNVTNMALMFVNTGAFNQPLDNWDVSSVEDMNLMFFRTIEFNQPIDVWDVSNVRNMSRMFEQAPAFNQSIDSWDVSSVTDMSRMFQSAIAFNQPLDSWDVSSVTRMNGMFRGTTNFDQPLNSWNVSAVTTMEGMFANAENFNQPIGNWDVSEVVTMESMFQDTMSFNQLINSWDVSQVLTMRSMFDGAVSFDQPLGDWNVSSVVFMASMFEDAQVFNQPIDSWNVSAVADMSRMFRNAQLFNQPIGSWDVSSVTLMNAMFESAQVFNQSINAWDVASVTRMDTMFKSAMVFDQPLGDWDTGEALNMFEMFREASAFNQPIDNWNVAFVTTMEAMFQDAISYNQSMNSWNVASVTTMQRMFRGAVAFNAAIDDWNVRRVLTMNEMFQDATSFNQTINSWRVVGVENMNNMFRNASAYNQPLDRWDLGSVSMSSMFRDALVFNQFLGDWDVSQVSNMTNMLDNTALSLINYDNTLIAWSEQSLPSGIIFGALGLPYCDAQEERQSIIDNFGWSIVGDVLDCPLPACTQLIAPLNGAVDVPINTNLSWESILYARNYRISVRVEPGGILLVDNEVVSETSYEFLTDFGGGETVFVTIIPFNETGDAVGCAEESFTIINDTTPTVPECTRLSNPLIGDVDVLVGTNLSWNPIANADGYRISIGTSTGATDIINNQDVGNVTTFDIPTDLPEDTAIFVTITPFNTVGDAIGCTEESFTTEIVPAPPTCTTLSDPINAAVDVPIDTDISWNASDNTTGYLLSVATTSGGTNIINNLNVGNVTTFDLPSNLPENRRIYVTIIPFNEVGDAIGCIEESFTTAAAPAPPACTSLSNPLNGATAVALGTDLSWNVAASATGYRITVGTTNGGTDIINNQDVGNVTTFDLPTDLPENATIYVTIVSYNGEGDAVGCAEESFTTGTVPVPPMCTTLSDPLNGATDVAIDTDLVWNAATGAAGYRISIGTTNGGTDIVNNQDVGNVTTFDIPVNLPENTTIYVLIIPFNDAGDAIGCVEESFSTATLPIAPVCTSLSDPLNGAINVAVTTDLSWNSVADAEGYRISVGTTNGGTDIVNNQDVGNVTTFDIPVDLPDDTTIFVTVTPFNTAGDAQGCIEESFTTIAAAEVPSCTALSNPLNGMTNVAITTDLSWNAATDATGYRISIGTSSGGTDLIDDLDVGNTTTFDIPNDLPEDATIFVTIIPFNSVGDAVACAEESFSTEVVEVVPLCTTLSNPLNEATNVPTDVSLSWVPVDNALGYNLTIGTTPGGTDILNNQDVGNTTTYNFPEVLPENTTIYVSIIPFNTVGNASGCAEENFRTETADNTKYGFSPDGDGVNEFWRIDGIENYPDNLVTIYNRLGNTVFQIQGYDNNTRVFYGEANKSRGLGANELPEGTYFFDIQIDGPNNLRQLKGFLVLKR